MEKSADPQALVLIIEDEPDAREAMAMLLEMEGYDVVAAANGRQAFEILKALPPPRVILLDLMMPVMDGWRFRELQLADPRFASIPVVLVTATDLSQHPPSEFADVPVLVKPVEPEALFARVKERCV
jgi:CheY-like chemotaxis protein